MEAVHTDGKGSEDVPGSETVSTIAEDAVVGALRDAAAALEAATQKQDFGAVVRACRRVAADDALWASASAAAPNPLAGEATEALMCVLAGEAGAEVHAAAREPLRRCFVPAREACTPAAWVAALRRGGAPRPAGCLLEAVLALTTALSSPRARRRAARQSARSARQRRAVLEISTAERGDPAAVDPSGAQQAPDGSSDGDDVAARLAGLAAAQLLAELVERDGAALLLAEEAELRRRGGCGAAGGGERLPRAAAAMLAERDVRWQRAVGSLLRAGHVAANRLRHDAPEVFFAKRFQPAIARQWVGAMLDASVPLELEGGGSPPDFVLHVLLQLLRAGQTRVVCRQWVAAVEGEQGSAGRSGALLALVPDQHATRFAAELVRACGHGGVPMDTVKRRLQRVFGSAAVGGTPSPVMHALAFAVPVRHTLSLPSASALIDVLAGCWSAGDVRGSLVQAASRAASIWADDSWVSTREESLQRSLTACLVAWMKHLSPAEINGTLLSPLLSGVQARIGSEQAHVRLDGMRLARAFSQRISPDEPISFPELDEAERVETAAAADNSKAVSGEGAAKGDTGEAAPAADAAASPTAPQPSTPPRPRTERRLDAPARLDPDEILTRHDDDSESDEEVVHDVESGAADDGAATHFSDAASVGSAASDSSSDGSLVPYDLPAEESEPLPSYVYLRDALAAVQDKEDYEKVKGAIAALPGLVRDLVASEATSGELAAMAVPVVRTLLFLENRFSLDDFDTQRAETIVACLVGEPLVVGRFLARQVFAEERHMGTRLEALHFLTRGAQELAGVDDATRQRGRLQRIAAREAAAADRAANVVALPAPRDDAAEKRAARERGEIGRVKKRFRKPQEAPKAAPNRLAPVAWRFVFELTRRITDTSAPVDLFRRDSALLSQLLRTLSVLLDCAKLSPDAPRIAATLMELVLVMRFHDVAAVRQGTLLVLASVAMAVPHFGRADLLTGLAECVQWLVEVAKRDPDTGCRELATLLLQRGVFRELLRAPKLSDVAAVAAGHRM